MSFKRSPLIEAAPCFLYKTRVRNGQFLVACAHTSGTVHWRHGSDVTYERLSGHQLCLKPLTGFVPYSCPEGILFKGILFPNMSGAIHEDMKYAISIIILVYLRYEQVCSWWSAQNRFQNNMWISLQSEVLIESVFTLRLIAFEPEIYYIWYGLNREDKDLI